MKKIKMIFPDGSIKDIEEADVSVARSMGAKEYTEPEKNGKKVSMQFPDGAIKDIETNDLAMAESLGAVKKKEDTNGPSNGLALADKQAVLGYMQSLKTPATPTTNNGYDQAIARTKPLLQINKDGSRRLSTVEIQEEVKLDNQQKIKNKIDTVTSRVYDGSATIDDLNSISGLEEAKPFLTSYLNAYADKDKLPAPESILSPGEHWETAVKNSNFENRPISVKQIDDNVKVSDQIISGLSGSKLNISKVFTGTMDAFSGPGSTDDIDIPKIDSNNPYQIGELIKRISQSNSLTDASGQNITDKKQEILTALNYKLDNIKRTENIAPEIDALDSKIANAIGDIEQDVTEITSADPTARTPNTDERKITAFKRGLNYLKSTDIPTYLNVIRGINDKEQIAETDYQSIIAKGQQLENFNTFIAGATDKEKIGAETNFSLETKSSRVAKTSGIFGEFFKQAGISKGHFSDEDIDYAAKTIDWAAYGMKPPTEKELNFIKSEEDRLFYDQIPKNGAVFSFFKGAEQPFLAIARTAQDVTSGSTATDYLRSKELNRPGSGGQLTPDEKGQYGQRLASDRDNIWYDVLEGAGAFIPQILLTRGLGTPFTAAAKSAASAIPYASLTAEQLVAINTATGTLISSYLQSYGDGYETALQKTGDPVKAQKIGAIGGMIDGIMEQWLPETKIGRNIARNLRGDVSEKIAAIIRKGGDPKDLINSTQNLLKPFVAEYLNVTGQEMAEEGSAVLLKQLTETIVSPETAATNDVMHDLGQTLWSTALQTFIPAVGSGGAKAKNRFTQKVFNEAAIKFDYSVDALKKSLLKETISQDEYNRSISLLAAHRNSIANAPKEDAEGKFIPAKDRNEFAYQETRIKINEAKAKADGISDVEKEVLEKKIKESQDIQRAIVMPEKVAIKPEPLSPEQELFNQIKDKADEGYKMTLQAAEDKGDISKGLEYVQEKFAENPVKFRADFGDEITDKVLEKVPTEKLKESIDYLIDKVPDDPSIPVLDKLIAERETEQSKEGAKIESAVIDINGKTYEGKNHAEAILKAKDDGQDISQVDRSADGKFKLSDGTIIDRAEAKSRFGQDRSELLIPQDDAADKANEDYQSISKEPASGSTEGGAIETENAVMEGDVLNEVEVDNEKVKLPEKGFVIDGVYLKEGKERGKGHGQELYKKALDEHGVLYSFWPISEDAMRVHDKLEEKGIAKVENITLSDGTELRKITKSGGSTEGGKEFANPELKPISEKFGERWGLPIDEKTAQQIKDIIDNNDQPEGINKLRLVRVRLQNSAASEGGGAQVELDKQKQNVTTEFNSKISTIRQQIDSLDTKKDETKIVGLADQITELEKQRDEKIASLDEQLSIDEDLQNVDPTLLEEIKTKTQAAGQAAPHVTMAAAGRTSATDARQQLQDAGGVVFEAPIVKDKTNAPLHDFGFGQATKEQLQEIMTGQNYTMRQRGMAAAYLAALRLTNNNPENFTGRLFAMAANKEGTRIRIVYDTRKLEGEGNPAIHTINGEVVINAYRLGDLLVNKFGGEKRFTSWLESSLQEEVIHLAATRVATEVEINQVAAEMTDKQKDKVRQLYDSPGTKLTDYQLAQEYLRMIYQEKVFGTTTEMMQPGNSRSVIRNIAQRLLTYIKQVFLGTQNSKAQQIIRRIDNFVKGKEVWRVGPEGTQRLAASEGDDLSDLYDEFKAKKKIRVSADEAKKLDDEAKAAFEKELGGMGQDEQSEQTGEYNFGEDRSDGITGYKLQTNDKIDKIFGTEQTAQEVWEEMPSGDRFNAQVNMLEDGANMIGIAQTMFGGPDVKTYGPPLLSFIKSMKPTADNKKAILLATLLGEIKYNMESTGSREMQQLYDQTMNYYKNLMHTTAQTLVAGRLLRLFRDKYMSDIYEDIILEEREAAALRDLKSSIADTEISPKDAEEHQAKKKKGKSKDKVDTDRKDTKKKKAKKKEKEAKRKPGNKTNYEKKYAAKEKEVKKKYKDKNSLLGMIIKKINDINCP